MMSSILESFEALREQLFRYYDTPFGWANPGLSRERRRRLDQDGVVYREPWMEPQPAYVSAGRTVEETLRSIDAPAGAAELLRRGLLPPAIQRLWHLPDAMSLLRRALAPERPRPSSCHCYAPCWPNRSVGPARQAAIPAGGTTVGLSSRNVTARPTVPPPYAL
jgi:hypothetical protein